MRSGRVWAGAVLLSGLMAGSVAAGHGSPWPPRRVGPAEQWKGRFTYERNFASRSDACDFQGHEAMQGEISCSGDDLAHLRCSAQGTVGYAYVQKAGADGQALRQRTDAGEYSGVLSHHLNLVGRNGQGWRYDLGIDANVPVHYTEAAGANSRSGSYVLDVAAGTAPAQFNPASGEIAFDRSQPITEPGPQACGSTMHNGKTHFAVRLLAVR